MKTKAQIEYKAAPYGRITTIPAGTPVTPATNLPQGGFWVKAWQGMTEKAESWGSSYGFHVTSEEVE